MKTSLLFVISFLCLIEAYGQNGKSYSISGQSDSLFVEMTYFNKSDSIFFYIFDHNMNHVAIEEVKGQINFIYGKNASIIVKLDSSKYNKTHERIQLALPKSYWMDFVTCELYIPIKGKMSKFTIINEKEKKVDKHHDMPSPGGHTH